MASVSLVMLAFIIFLSMQNCLIFMLLNLSVFFFFLLYLSAFCVLPRWVLFCFKIIKNFFTCFLPGLL